jgi:hypothetical protein
MAPYGFFNTVPVPMTEEPRISKFGWARLSITHFLFLFFILGFFNFFAPPHSGVFPFHKKVKMK